MFRRRVPITGNRQQYVFSRNSQIHLLKKLLPCRLDFQLAMTLLVLKSIFADSDRLNFAFTENSEFNTSASSNLRCLAYQRERKTYIDVDIFVNCNWVDTPWQKYSAHLHTNNTQNNTKQAILCRTTQKFWKSADSAPSRLVIPWHLPYKGGAFSSVVRQMPVYN